MEGPTSSGGSRNRLTCLTLQEHDDDEERDKIYKTNCLNTLIQILNSKLIIYRTESKKRKRQNRPNKYVTNGVYECAPGVKKNQAIQAEKKLTGFCEHINSCHNYKRKF